MQHLFKAGCFIALLVALLFSVNAPATFLWEQDGSQVMEVFDVTGLVPGALATASTPHTIDNCTCNDSQTGLVTGHTALANLDVFVQSVADYRLDAKEVTRVSGVIEPNSIAE